MSTNIGNEVFVTYKTNASFSDDMEFKKIAALAGPKPAKELLKLLSKKKQS